MADLGTIVSKVTTITTAWFQDVNNSVYRAGTTPTAIDTAHHAAPSKTPPVDADEIAIADSASSFAFARLTFANLRAQLFTLFGAQLNAATGKATPVDADSLPIQDSAATNATKQVTWANVKATLKTYFDAIYANLVSPTFTGTPLAPTAAVGASGTQIATLDFVSGGVHLPADFRLSLTTATPVTIADVTAATILYYTPYHGNRIALYSGTVWQLFTTAEISIAIPATTSQMYDVFVYNNAGVPTLELTAWTNDTTRATALVMQDGVYVKTGALTRRFVGCVRTTTVSGQTEDSAAKRYVWNMYNRVPRKLKRFETTASWTYTTATWRQANAATANQVDFIRGLDEDSLSVFASVTAGNSSAGVNVAISLGLDSTTTPSTDALYTNSVIPVATYTQPYHSHYVGYPGLGRHYLVWLEISAATGTTTWYGTATNAPWAQSGISGTMTA